MVRSNDLDDLGYLHDLGNLPKTGRFADAYEASLDFHQGITYLDI